MAVGVRSVQEEVTTGAAILEGQTLTDAAADEQRNGKKKKEIILKESGLYGGRIWFFDRK